MGMLITTKKHPFLVSGRNSFLNAIDQNPMLNFRLKNVLWRKCVQILSLQYPNFPFLCWFQNTPAQVSEDKKVGIFLVKLLAEAR